MSSSKKQSLIIIGISCLLIAGVLLYFALSQPRIYLDDNTNSDSTTTTTAQQAQEQELSTEESASTAVTFPLNINSCTEEELLSVNGLGEARAVAIVEYREVLGGYTSVEQIKDIKGISDNLYQQISPFLCV